MKNRLKEQKTPLIANDLKHLRISRLSTGPVTVDSKLIR
jgi:hypothetical protein